MARNWRGEGKEPEWERADRRLGGLRDADAEEDEEDDEPCAVFCGVWFGLVWFRDLISLLF